MKADAGAPSGTVGPAVRPDDCTSLMCAGPQCGYCGECSHAVFRGKARIGKTMYRWEFNPHAGPLFSRRKDGVCDWIPGERHPVWGVFQKWADRKFKSANAPAHRRGEAAYGEADVGQEVKPCKE